MSPLPSKNVPLNVAVLIAIHLAIAIPLAYVLGIWNDEASTLYATRDGFWLAFQTAATEQKQAPLYFWIISLWRQLNDSIFFARFFSVICSAAAIWLFSRLCVRILPKKRVLLATAFFALHPALIWASLEIRVYSLVILLSVALIYSFLDAFWEETDSTWSARIQFLLLAIISLYTNYYLGFLLVGFLVPLMILRRWRSAFSYIALMAIAGLAFLPMLLAVRSEFMDRSSSYRDPRSLIVGLKLLWEYVLSFILPTELFPAGDASTVSIIRLWLIRVLLLITAGFTLARWKRTSAQTVALAAIAGNTLVFLLLAYFLLGRWLVEFRHSVILFAPLLIFGASLLSDIFPERDKESSLLSRLIVPAFAIIVSASFFYGAVNIYPNFTKKGDWQRVGKYLEQSERANQPIVIFNTYDALALPYHYKGVNKIYPDERFFEFSFGTTSPERTKKRTDYTISKIPPEAAEIWLIVSDECKWPGVCEPFEEFIRMNYDRVEEMEFYDQKVTLLRKKQPATAFQ